jgi:hypothetical protein
MIHVVTETDGRKGPPVGNKTRFKRTRHKARLRTAQPSGTKNLNPINTAIHSCALSSLDGKNAAQSPPTRVRMVYICRQMLYLSIGHPSLFILCRVDGLARPSRHPAHARLEACPRKRKRRLEGDDMCSRRVLCVTMPAPVAKLFGGSEPALAGPLDRGALVVVSGACLVWVCLVWLAFVWPRLFAFRRPCCWACPSSLSVTPYIHVQ